MHIRALSSLIFSVFIVGCAAEKHIVYFDVPSHSLGRIIAQSTMAKSRTDILEVQRQLVEFQNGHLDYLPDRVSRLIKNCEYILSQNIPYSSIVSLPPQGPTNFATESREARRIERTAHRPANTITKSSTANDEGRDKLPKPSPPQILGSTAPNPMADLGNQFIRRIANFENKSQSGSVKVAVHPFSIAEEGSSPGSRSTSYVLESEIERALIGAESVKVVTRRGLRDIQAEKKLSESEWNSGATQTKKYGVQDADLIIRGQATISTNRKTMMLNCELIDPSSGILVDSKNVVIQPRGGSVEYFLKN